MTRLLAFLAPRARALEALVGLALVTGGVAYFSVAVACIIPGVVIFVFAVWGRRIS